MRRILLLLALACAGVAPLSARAQTTLIRGNDLVSYANSSTSTLTSGSTFTGTWVSTLGFNMIVVNVSSDQISGTNGLQIQFSTDASNQGDNFSASFIDTSVGQTFAVPTKMQFARVVYTNGGTGQTSFRLQTILRTNWSGGDVVDLSDPITVSDHGQVTRALISGRTSSSSAVFNDAAVFPSGDLRVMEAPSQVFYDPVDGSASLDTTNRWNTPTAGGTGVAAAQSGGVITLGAGTTANSYSYLTSRPTFTSSTPGWIRYAHNIALPYPVVATTYMAWGGGNVQATPSGTGCSSSDACSNTFTDGAVFEVGFSGKMWAAVYQNSARTAIADLSVAMANGVIPQPANSGTHNYEVWYRPTKIYWLIDGAKVAESSYSQSQLNTDTLHDSYLVLQGGTSAATLTSNATSVSDSARNNQKISDGTYPWQTAAVNATGGLAVAPQTVNTTASGTISTACAGGTSCAATSYVTIGMVGKLGAGAEVTAISSPSGITLQCDISMNGGTIWSEAAAGDCVFDSAKTGVKSSTVTAFAVGDAYSLLLSTGVTNIRVRASALTSGTVTFSVTGTDTADPSELFGSPGGASSMPPAVAVVGAQDAVTTTTVNPVNSANQNTTPAAGARYLLEMPALGRSAVQAVTAGNVGGLSIDSVTSFLNITLRDASTYTGAQVAAHNGAAPGAGVATMPGLFRSALSAGTAGRSGGLALDATTGFQLFNISDGASYLKASVLANDTTAILNHLSVGPAVARATPTSVTAGRGEMVQVDAATGAQFVEGVATTAAIGPSVSFVSGTTGQPKASAGNLYGINFLNAAAATNCVQILNVASGAACSASPVLAFCANANAAINFPPGAMPMVNNATGIGWAICTSASCTSCPGTSTSVSVFYK